MDTPGLVDGDMKYPFDVNKAILWLGKNLYSVTENKCAGHTDWIGPLNLLSLIIFVYSINLTNRC